MRLLCTSIFFTVALWAVVSAKIYQRCELARELRNFDIPEREIPTWVCIAQHESLLDTAAMNPGSGDHGLFQISQIYWCSPPGYGCNTPCDKFRDDDISDDLQCIRRIYNEHKRISGDGFNAWVVYSLYCKGDTSVYLSGCSEDDDIPTTTPGNSTENEISPEEEEDGDGYEFPPLPSYPKSSKNASALPFNKKSIHDYVLASSDSPILTKMNNNKLPYSRKSINHFVLVDNGVKSQELSTLRPESTTISMHDFKSITKTPIEPMSFKLKKLSHATEKNPSHSKKSFVDSTSRESSSETPVQIQAIISETNRPIFTKESIYEFKLVSDTTENIQTVESKEHKQFVQHSAPLKTTNKFSNENVTDKSSKLFLNKNKETIEAISKPIVHGQIDLNKSEKSKATIRLITTLKPKYTPNTTPKNIITTRSNIQRKTIEKNLDTTDLEVQSSTLQPIFLKTVQTNAEKLPSTSTSIKQVDSSSNKSEYKVITSTTIKPQQSVKLLSRIKDIGQTKSTTKLVPTTSSTTVQPDRESKQVTFAPGTFFNIQTLPPILPARPLRPPGQPPSRPNNRPGGPPRPMRPGGPNKIQSSNETLSERPYRPGFGPNRRPAFSNINSNSEEPTVVGNSELLNETLPGRPSKPGLGPNRRPPFNYANSMPKEPAISDSEDHTQPPKLGFNHNRRPALSNTYSNQEEYVITGRPKPGYNRRHPHGRKPNRNRSMTKDDSEHVENNKNKDIKPPETKVVTLNGNYMYYRTKYGFRLSRNI